MSEVKHKNRERRNVLDVADRLHSGAIHLLRRLRVRDRTSGIGPAQLSALSVLVFGGPRSLGELAEAEQVRPPTMSRIIDGLERASLVHRQASDDKRRLRLKATPKGKAIIQKSRRRRVESLAEVLASLSEQEMQHLAEFSELLHHIVQNLPSR